MPNEATAKCKEKLKNEIKEEVEPLSLPINFDQIFSEENGDTSLTVELQKKLRDVPKEVSQPIIRKAEFVDRVDDIENNPLQKKYAINFFGEQGKEEIIPVLEELKAEEQAKRGEKVGEIIKAINKAIDRIIVRMRKPNFSELELQGDFIAERRPWRAMLRVTHIENENLRIVLPGWDPEQEVQVSKYVFPEKLHKFLSPGARFFAKINIGADKQSELYFTEFEDKS